MKGNPKLILMSSIVAPILKNRNLYNATMNEQGLK